MGVPGANDVLFDLSYCSGMCGRDCPVRVRVSHGVVTDVWATKPNLFPLDMPEGRTIEDVFAQEDGPVRRDDRRVDIRYDPTWGFPASVETFCEPIASDCGTGYEVDNFRVAMRADRVGQRHRSGVRGG